MPNETRLRWGRIIAGAVHRPALLRTKAATDIRRHGLAAGALSYFDYRINFDWDISRQRVYADRSASMTTSFAEDFHHEVRRTVNHLWMVLKIRLGIYEPAESNHAHNLTKIAIQRLFQLRKDIDGT